MGNVVSIFNKKKRVPEPSEAVEYYLQESLEATDFTLLSTFEKRWDSEANLWVLEVTVEHKGNTPQQMAFWYDGDEPQYAMSIRPGGKFSYTNADRVVKIREG